MKSMFEPTRAEEIKDRVSHLKPGSAPQWGTMTPAQAVAHLSLSVEMGLGTLRLPRMLVGRIIGGVVRPLALGDDKPFSRNSPTAKELKIKGDRDLDAEQQRLKVLIDQFVAGGRQGCSTHPHAFFGRLTPDEWGILLYKHLDHHLRQFGV